jgi:hypothetical protein
MGGLREGAGFKPFPATSEFPASRRTRMGAFSNLILATTPISTTSGGGDVEVPFIRTL